MRRGGSGLRAPTCEALRLTVPMRGPGEDQAGGPTSACDPLMQLQGHGIAHQQRARGLHQGRGADRRFLAAGSCMGAKVRADPGGPELAQGPTEQVERVRGMRESAWGFRTGAECVRTGYTAGPHCNPRCMHAYLHGREPNLPCLLLLAPSGRTPRCFLSRLTRTMTRKRTQRR